MKCTGVDDASRCGRRIIIPDSFHLICFCVFIFNFSVFIF